jgi:hypothetical protein
MQTKQPVVPSHPVQSTTDPSPPIQSTTVLSPLVQPTTVPSPTDHSTSTVDFDRSLMPVPKGPRHPALPPNYVGEDGVSHYWLRVMAHNGRGGYKRVGTIRYHDMPPMPSEFDHWDRKFEQTWIRDEANDCWAQIPSGHSIPAYSGQQGQEDLAYAEGDLVGDFQSDSSSAENFPPASCNAQEENAESDVHESTPSESNFSDDRAAVVKKRKRKRDMGEEDSDTEQDDLEADEELRDEVVPEFPMAGHKSRRKGAHSKKSKGKRAQRYTDDEGTDGSGQEGEREGVVAEPGRGTEGSTEKSQGGLDVEGGGEDRERVLAKSKSHFKPGRWSKADDEVCQDFGSWVNGKADKISQRIKKNPSEIMLRAGLGIKLGKKNNAWPKFEKWYAEKYPKPPSSMSFTLFSLTHV